MNLQAIQKRLEELSAEALTLSNDLSFLLQGEVSRPSVQVQLALQVYNFQQVSAGDTLQFTAPFPHIQEHALLPAGNYRVVRVEDPHYDGIWSVMLEISSEDVTWINLNGMREPVYKVQVAQ